MFKNSQSRIERGASVIELLIMIAIVLILLLIWFAGGPRHLNRSRDEQRRSDLAKMRIALEDYANDHGCYPEPAVMQTCGGGSLKPYINELPCDPMSDEPYFYMRSNDCLSYGLFADLEKENDPISQELGCGSGCGPDIDGDGEGDYEYAVVGGNTTISIIEQTGSLPATCGSGDAKFCLSGGDCGACCPGANYRCNPSGTGCIYDPSCNGN